ncbi:MAG: GLPGLI family protein [Bacteroidales bacterium]|nr:GLPGLI family protein [Bacteroidales bacterium]
MKKVVVHIFFLMLPLLNVAAQPCRVWYSYQYKTDKDSETYRSDMNMKLDVCDGKAVWYSERTFLRDSLCRVAFDENGNVRNEEIYNQMLGNMGTGDGMVTFYDFNAQKLSQGQKYFRCFINGETDLDMPQWEITDETMVSRDGYNVRKAVADFMGRKWTVWYTEELPLPYGPWFFWGLPGLIIMAIDSEELFIFRYMGMEEIDNFNRYDTLWGWRHIKYSKNVKFFNLSLEDAERMYTRIMTDPAYETEMTGTTIISARDRNGDPIQRPGYIPLIPSRYWKDRER